MGNGENRKKTKILSINIMNKEEWNELKQIIGTEEIPNNFCVKRNEGIQIHLERIKDFKRITKILDQGKQRSILN